MKKPTTGRHRKYTDKEKEIIIYAYENGYSLAEVAQKLQSVPSYGMGQHRGMASSNDGICMPARGTEQPPTWLHMVVLHHPPIHLHACMSAVQCAKPLKCAGTCCWHAWHGMAWERAASLCRTHRVISARPAR